MHVQSCCFSNLNIFSAFLPFSLTSPSSFLKLPMSWYSPLRKPEGEWVQAFGSMISEMYWVDNCYSYLSNCCLEYHRTILTNACPPKLPQKLLRPKLVPILPYVTVYDSSGIRGITSFSRRTSAGSGCFAFLPIFSRKSSVYEKLTSIGWGWAKYRDLSVASRSIICRSRRLRQIIDVRDTGKSRYFVITEFNNCFIIRSPSLCFIFGKRSDLPFFTQERITRGFVYAWAEHYLQPYTVGRYCAWADHYL